MATRKGRPVANAQTILIGSIIPSGTVQTYPSDTAPEGYLVCDGSVVSRTTYSALFEVLGTSHGEGDGSTTFHLPDYRGRFLRGMDSGASRDPDAGSRIASNAGGNTGDAIGSVQGDAIRNISGFAGNFGGPWDTGGAFFSSPGSRRQGSTTGDAASSLAFSANRQVPTSTEIRPVNINTNYIIKV